MIILVIKENNMENLKWAKETFAKDKYATETTGIEILEARPQYAKCRLAIKSGHRNGMNVVMGGAVFTLADFTFAIASNTGKGAEPSVVSLSAQITYLSAAKDNELTAEAICIKDGRKTCYYEINITDENSKLIAKVNINGFNTI